MNTSNNVNSYEIVRKFLVSKEKELFEFICYFAENREEGDKLFNLFLKKKRNYPYETSSILFETSESIEKIYNFDEQGYLFEKLEKDILNLGK